jgi:predicted Zn-dependent protease
MSGISSRLLFLIAFLACFTAACTVRYDAVEPGLIPTRCTPTSADEKVGSKLFQELEDDYELCTTHPRYQQLHEVFGNITRQAKVGHAPWHVHIFSEPEVIDVRAVRGNRLFVWSGLLDAVENENELAAVLANELAHVLTRHTDAVQFHPLSEVFFQMASLAANVGLLYLSQGAVAITGNWSKWVYMKAANLMPLEREYSEEEEREAAGLASQILQASCYSLEALVAFWRRMDSSEATRAMSKGLQRDLSLEQRIAMLENILPEPVHRQDQEPERESELVRTIQ